MMRWTVFFSFALLFACRGAGQDIVSASSGVLQYFEGAVVLDNKPIEHQAAVFPSLKNGSILRTEKGRAELLLTPSVYLRVDENSSVRMASNSLSDTRLELIEGSAILDNLNASSTTPVVLIFRGSEVRFPKAGVYRVDSDLGDLQVYSGEASVKHLGVASTVNSTQVYYFLPEIAIKKLGDTPSDEFYDWARNRSDMIANENQIASADQAEADDPDPGSIAGFLGVPYSPSPAPLGSSPSLGNPLYGSGLDAFNPYLPTPYLGYGYLGYGPFPEIIVLSGSLHRPANPRWLSGLGTASHPRTIVARWPSAAPGITSQLPSTALRYPAGSTYRPAGTSIARPAVAPRPIASHPMVLGHR